MNFRQVMPTWEDAALPRPRVVVHAFVLVAISCATTAVMVASPSGVRVAGVVAVWTVVVAHLVWPSGGARYGWLALPLGLATLTVADGGIISGDTSSVWRLLVAIVAYPFLARALLERSDQCRRIRTSDLVVEAALVGAGTALMLQAAVDWRSHIGDPGWTVSHSGLPALLVGLDMALLVIAGRSLSEPAARRSPLGVITGGLAALLAVHLIGAIELASGIHLGSVTGILAIAALLVIAGCGVLPLSIWAPFEAIEPRLFSPGHAGVLVFSLVAAPGVLAIHSIRGVSVSTTIATGTVITAVVLSAYVISLLRDRANGEHQATHDALTDLPNRVLLVDRLERAIAHAGRNEQPVGLLFIDLDRFKDVNDTLGHRSGDQLLRETARRLVQASRHEDTVARLSGDEFAVLLPHLAEASDVVLVAERVLETLGDPIRLGEHLVRNQASIGVATFPQDGSTPHDLLTAADTAMYRAKDSGGGRLELYNTAVTDDAVSRLETETALFDGIERGELVLHYQPIVDAETGRIDGAEALVRWQHPEKGLLSPAHFVPVAEQSDLIVILGRWVLHEACSQLVRWSQIGLGDLSLAVNVSARHFRHDLVSDITKALRSTGANARKLVVEITESAAADDVELVAETLNELRDLGVGVAIDDFGTGYCGLQYLGDLPVTALKIDRSFVGSMTPRSAAIVAATIAMGKSLGLTVVAEGVETSEQRRFLELSGCHRLQGYYLGRPMPPDELLEQIQSEESNGHRQDAEPAQAPTLRAVGWR